MKRYKNGQYIEMIPEEEKDWREQQNIKKILGGVTMDIRAGP